MKRYRIWMLVVLVFAVMMCACNDDEPKKYEGNTTPPTVTEPDDDKPDDEQPGEETTAITLEMINAEWYGQRDISVGESCVSEILDVWLSSAYAGRVIYVHDELIKSQWVGQRNVNEDGRFMPKSMCLRLKRNNNNVVEGYSVVGDTEGYGNDVKKYRELRSYKFEGNKFVGLFEEQEGDDNSFVTMTFEYRDGYLYVQPPGYETFILGREKVCVDVNGRVIDMSDKALKRVWIHENGQNILDLSGFQAI